MMDSLCRKQKFADTFIPCDNEKYIASVDKHPTRLIDMSIGWADKQPR